MNNESIFQPRTIKIAKNCGIALIGTIFFFSSFSIIPTSYVGIKSRFNVIASDTPLEAGFHFKVPFLDDIEHISLKQIQQDFTIKQTQTIDLQPVTVSVKVAYTVPQSMVIRNKKEIAGDLFIKIIEPRAKETIRDELAKYPAEKLINSRTTLISAIQTQLSARVKEHAVIQDISIIEMDFENAEYKKAISDKVIVKEEANKAIFQTQIIQEEAKQRMIQAKAEADSQLIIAKAEAEGLKIKSSAVAQNPKLIEFEKTKADVEKIRLMTSPDSKWDGKMPATLIMGGEDKFIFPLNNQNK